MSKGIFITFDSYYGVDAYNSFKVAARNNGIEFEEYLRIRTPFNRFIKLKSKSDLPSFVNYDFATTSDKRLLISTIKAVYPNEEYLLQRRPGQDISYERYVMPKMMENMAKEKFLMVFKSFDRTELQKISEKLGDTKIFKWGQADIKKYNIYYCFNPYIKGIVDRKNVLMEFGKEADTGLKYEKSMLSTYGDLEYYLNHYVLVIEKLENKYWDSEYWLNGKIHPLKKESFIV